MEKKYVPAGVFLTCDKGVTPSTLSVTFNANTVIYGQNLATEADKIPMVNVKPMGVCTITKGPCVPAPLMWNPLQNDVLVGNQRLLLEDSKLQCSLGGRISIFFTMAEAMAAAAPAPAPEKSLLDKADDYLATLGPVGDYARFQMGMAEGLYAGGESMVEGLWGLAKGGWNAVTHPVETANAIGDAASSAADWASKGENWSNAASAAGDGISSAADWASHGENWSNAWDGASDWASKQSPRDWGKIGGRATFEVAMAVGTGGAGTAANVAGKAGEAANLLSKAGEAANLADKGLDAARLAERAAELANLAEKAGEAGNAAGKAGVVGKVTTGADGAADLARAGEKAEELGQAAKTTEAVEGCAARGKCTEVGHPVDVSNGMVFTQQTDFYLPGPVPLVWERTWYSRSVRRGALGHGWHHRYDMALAVEDDGRLALRMADGRLAVFAAPALGGKSFNRNEKLEAEQLPTGQYRVWDLSQRVWYIFAPHPAQANQVLAAVENANGFALRLAYNDAGHLQTMTDSAGRRLDFDTDVYGRITDITGPDPDLVDGRITLAQYQYDEAGNLATTTDALGYSMLFRYEGHLLAQETNRVGLSFYFTYDGTDHTARCLRTWGDGGIYDTKLTYPAPDLTVVADSLDAVTHYTHAQGLATVIVDALGGVTQRVYNAYGELEIERDPLGNATVYDYNSRGLVTQITQPDGARTQYAYNTLDLPAQAQDANGSTWLWKYDEAGNLNKRQDPLGATSTYRYEQGLLTEFGNAAGHRTRLAYDAHHNLRHLITPDNGISTRQYDQLGRLVQVTDALGAVQRLRYDRLGQLLAVREPDGTERHLQYDGEGNVVRASDGTQEVTFEYTGQGRLARRQQANTEVHFHYDLEGRLTGLDNEHHETYRFALNALGQVVSEQGFDGLTRHYQHDAAGRVTAIERPAGRTTRYVYDPAGRLAEVAHNDEAPTTYRYYPNGTLREASTADSTVLLERDALGQVVSEVQNGVTIESAYNLLQQRISLHSSLGAALALAYDTAGSVTLMQADGWSSRIERDARGLELQRTLSGGVEVNWQRDALGRPTSQRIAAGGNARPADARQRRYHWQGPDQLLTLDDSLLGETRYAYNPLGYLTEAAYADGTQELRQADAVGNFFRTHEHTDRRYGQGGQLREANGTRYRYDEEGNLVRKTLPDGKIWRYAWDGAGQLTRVTRPDGYAITFTYDALGRRISKRFRGRTTKWAWDGDKILHEWTELEVGPGLEALDNLTTWLFNEDSFTPAAKLTRQGSYSVVADHLGTPLELYDAQGRKAWQAQLDSYGAVREGRGTPQDCPFRYQGQYEDVETGLYYNRFRYYDPEAGSYISQDPTRLAGGSALYGYVRNTTSWLDVLGWMPWPNPTRQGHHLVYQNKASGVPGLEHFADANTPTYFFNEPYVPGSHEAIHAAQRPHVGPRQGEWKGTADELLEASGKGLSHPNISNIKGELREIGSGKVHASNVSPEEAFQKLMEWHKSKSTGLCP
jgi:RHS repeat-associated protein